MAKVVVGISGGVDSSVAAHLLIEQGHEVIGLFMQNWHETTGVLSGECPWEEDMIVAQLVAKKLNIPFHHVDLSEIYREKVVGYLFDEYEKGRTPNPDVLCNREIKFDVFIDAAKKYGADYIATGHYCRKESIEKDGQVYHQLLAGVDGNKDQSYFLCQLSQKQLEMAMFPIGHLEKPEVRRIADELDLPTATRKDSQGICFIGKVDLPVFLQQKLDAKKGIIVEIPDREPEQIDLNSVSHDQLKELAKPYNFREIRGQRVGDHNGAHFYTIGQRKGLNVGGKEKPLFVLGIDVEKNVVYTGQGHDHFGLNRSALFINKEEVHWIRPDFELKPGEVDDYLVRIRYRQPLQKAKLYMFEEGLYILFEQPQRGIAAGQFASWYKEDELIGSGVINQ